MTTTTTTATPAKRLLADYQIHYPSAEATRELTDSKAAMLSWAGRDGRYTHSDTEAVLQGHGETFGAWVDHCCTHALPDAYNAAALLTWLGY
jgi:hypothetical protein